MGGKGDHELPIGLGAERDAKATAAADALDLVAASPPAAGGTGHKAHALMAEHGRRIGGHHADRRQALALQPRRDGAGLSGGIDHQPIGKWVNDHAARRCRVALASCSSRT